MKKTDIVLDKAIKLHQDKPIVLEPGKEALNFPVPLITFPNCPAEVCYCDRIVLGGWDKRFCISYFHL